MDISFLCLSPLTDDKLEFYPSVLLFIDDKNESISAREMWLYAVEHLHFFGDLGHLQWYEKRSYAIKKSFFTCLEAQCLAKYRSILQ